VGKVNAQNGSAPINLPQKKSHVGYRLALQVPLSSSCLLQVSSSAMEELAS